MFEKKFFFCKFINVCGYYNYGRVFEKLMFDIGMLLEGEMGDNGKRKKEKKVMVLFFNCV